jgi:hypothetical protein
MNLELGIQAAPNDPKNLTGVELVEIRRSTGADKASTTDVVSKRVDTSGRVNWLLGRIGMLEKTRSELIAAKQAAGEGAGDVAQDLVATVRAMVDLETKRLEHDTDE